MKEPDFANISGEDFRDAIEYFTDSSNEYSMDELHDAFLVVTRLYLDELISARLLENAVVDEFGEDAAKRFFEAVAGSNETVREADQEIAFEDDPESVIHSQFNLIEKLNQQRDD